MWQASSIIIQLVDGLINGRLADKHRERGDLAGAWIGRQSAELDLLADAVVSAGICRPLFVAGRIQNEQRQDVNVPHAINARVESRSQFPLLVFIPLPLSLGNLSQDEPDDGESSTQQRRQHQELEAIYDSFVVQAAGTRHARQRRTFHADVHEYLPHHVAQENEIDYSRYPCHNYESQLEKFIKEITTDKPKEKSMRKKGYG